MTRRFSASSLAKAYAFPAILFLSDSGTAPGGRLDSRGIKGNWMIGRQPLSVDLARVTVSWV